MARRNTLRGLVNEPNSPNNTLRNRYFYGPKSPKRISHWSNITLYYVKIPFQFVDFVLLINDMLFYLFDGSVEEEASGMVETRNGLW